MKNKRFGLVPCFVFFVALALTSGLAAQSEPPQLELPTQSPAANVQQRIGVTDIEVKYHRPSVKGRQIFGGLVPYGEIWRTGANAATTVSFSTPVKVGGVDVAAGTYALFTVPNADEWTVVLHENSSQWGSYAYDSESDVARFSVAPVKLADSVETLSIGFGDLSPNAGTLEISWEKTRVPVRIEIDVVGQLVPKIEAAMQAEGKKPYFGAAMFYYDNDLDLDKAAEWMSAALEGRPGHVGMLYRLALIKAKKGDKAGALEAARGSLESAGKIDGELGDEYKRLNDTLIAQLSQ